MSWTYVVLVVLATLTAGCGTSTTSELATGSSSPSAPSTYPLGITLPESGLVVAGKDGVHLYTLDGSRLGSWKDLDAVTDPLILLPGPRILSRGKQRFLLSGGSSTLKPYPEDVPLASGYALRIGPKGSAFELRHAGETEARIPPGDLRFMVSYRRDFISFQADGRKRVIELAKAASTSDGLAGCHLADRGFFICGPYSAGATPDAPRSRERMSVRTRDRSSDLAPLPDAEHGHWNHLARSPDGQELILQHSGECEIPSVYSVPTTGGNPRALKGGAEARHIGWSADGRALVVFTEGICGKGIKTPGIYAVKGDDADIVLKVTEPGTKTVATWAPLDNE